MNNLTNFVLSGLTLQTDPKDVGKYKSNEFTKMGVKLVTNLQKVLNRCALMVERSAKLFCPVDTGRLRASIAHRVVEENKQTYAEIGTSVEYAPYVEFGSVSRNRQPHPFLGWAYDANKDKVAQEIMNLIDETSKFEDSKEIITAKVVL